MRLATVLAALCLILAGCGATKAPYASDAQIAAVSYRDPGPAYLRLYTMINNRTGQGAHSSLMVNGSQRVVFDPAGSFYADIVPERNDVLYGFTPAVATAYKSSHARSTHHVVMQTIEVTPQQAETALVLVQQYGAVPGSFCANATSNVLRQVPGFESIQTTMYPNKLVEQLEAFPGVRTERYYEEDSPDLQAALAAQNAALTQ